MILVDGYNYEANLHLFSWKELNILLDVNSGAIHVLDDLANELVKKIIDYQGDYNRALKEISLHYPDEQVRELWQELEAAWKQEAIFSQAEVPLVDLSEMQVKAICLNVAHSCNMKCHYCFASQGDFGGKPSLMSLETGKKAMEFLIEKSGNVRNLEVDFFGGEPLLVTPMLRELVKYCRNREEDSDKRFNFTLTTNCLLLDEEMMDFVIENDISVILSMDGRKEINDQHRVLNNGKGTYDLIVPRIRQMLQKKPVSCFVRGTFSRKNLDFSEDLKHMISLGFEGVSLEPATGPDNGFSIQERDLPVVLEEYEKLTDILLESYLAGQNIDFFHYNLNLQKGPCLAKRVTGCGAGIEYLVITPEGDIYPCHQFVCEERFFMGNIYSGQLNNKIRKAFENNQLKDKECQECWARYFCGGGCHANAYYSNGDMSKPHQLSCIMHKKRIEGAIYLDLKNNLIING